MKKILIVLFFILFIFTPKEIGAKQQITLQPGDPLQSIIEQAEAGTEIRLLKGEYPGGVSINKSIIIRGEEGAVINGYGKENVLELNADGGEISGVSIINSGNTENASGILVNSSNNIIRNNTFKNIQFGIYINGGKQNQIVNNNIFGNKDHFSKRGNGIHLFKSQDTFIEGNTIDYVQDGIYFDFSKGSTVQHNSIQNSRYAAHVMYAKDVSIQGNTLRNSINGLMIMQARDIQVVDNLIQENINFRGYGVLIFDSDHITFKDNQVFYNSTGMSLQDARDSVIVHNTFAGNQIGLDAKDRNERNEILNNNFIGNIVQTKVLTPLQLSGNYWDDYKGLDLDHDQIGDAPYQLGTMYDRLVNESPEFQFYFESPSIKVWSAVEELLPVITDEKGEDINPAIEPVQYDNKEENRPKSNILIVILTGLMLLASTTILYKGGK